MDKITPENFEQQLNKGFEQTLARIGHVNRVIEGIGNKHVLVDSFDFKNISSWTPSGNAFAKVVTNGKPKGKRIIDAYAVVTQNTVNNANEFQASNRVGTLTYSGISGGVFSIGDTLTANDGAEGTIVSVTATKIIISTTPGLNVWSAAITINNGAGVTANITSAKTTFAFGDLVTANNGATGTVGTDDGEGVISVNGLTGNWSVATSLSNAFISLDLVFGTTNASFISAYFSTFGGQGVSTSQNVSFSGSTVPRGKFQYLLASGYIIPAILFIICLLSYIIPQFFALGSALAMAPPVSVGSRWYKIYPEAMDVTLTIHFSTFPGGATFTAGHLDFYLVVEDF